MSDRRRPRAWVCPHEKPPSTPKDNIEMSRPMPTIRVNNPTDMVSLVPYLLGFHPDESLVVVALHEGRVVVATCVDLPVGVAGRDNYHIGVSALATAVARHGATEVALIGFGAADPVATAVALARDVLTHAGIPTVEAIRVSGGRIYSLSCDDPFCCPPDGIPFDPTASPVTADARLAGLVAAPHRDAIAEQLKPDEGAGRTAFLAATEAAARRLLVLLDAARPVGADRMNWWLDSPQGRVLLKTAIAAFDEGLAIGQGGRRLEDEQAAWLCVLLKVPDVLDYALRCTTGDNWQIQLWTDLVRRAHTRLLATPAALLAVCALRAGNGALAGAAVDRALSAEPDNRLARYLHMIVAAGIAPHEIATLLAAPDPARDGGIPADG
jgi:hypothetical protein